MHEARSRKTSFLPYILGGLFFGGLFGPLLILAGHYILREPAPEKPWLVCLAIGIPAGLAFGTVNYFLDRREAAAAHASLAPPDARLASASAPSPAPASPPLDEAESKRSPEPSNESTLAGAIATVARFFRRGATEHELAEALEATVRCSCGEAFVLGSATKTVKEGNSLSMVFTCPACGSTSSVKYG